MSETYHEVLARLLAQVNFKQIEVVMRTKGELPAPTPKEDNDRRLTNSPLSQTPNPTPLFRAAEDCIKRQRKPTAASHHGFMAVFEGAEKTKEMAHELRDAWAAFTVAAPPKEPKSHKAIYPPDEIRVVADPSIARAAMEVNDQKMLLRLKYLGFFGAANFEKLEKSKGSEIEVYHENIKSMVRQFGLSGFKTMASLGPGTGVLDVKLLAQMGIEHYIPIDISDGLLYKAWNEASPTVEIPVCILGDFETNPKFIFDRVVSNRSKGNILYSFLGNTFGSLDHTSNGTLLDIARAAMRGTQDRLLLHVTVFLSNAEGDDTGIRLLTADSDVLKHNCYEFEKDPRWNLLTGSQPFEAAFRYFFAYGIARRQLGMNIGDVFFKTQEIEKQISLSESDLVDRQTRDGAAVGPPRKTIKFIVKQFDRPIQVIHRYEFDGLRRWLSKEKWTGDVALRERYSSCGVYDALFLLQPTED
ncbi:MAG: L-histidine N(alpha)-methyltransferase [Fimbriimonadaceae bacterium]